MTPFVRLLVSAAFALLSAPVDAATAPATTSAPAKGGAVPLTAPPADGVRAYDRPSDDGTTIVLEWPRPDAQAEGAFYVVEVARSPDGFQTGEFRTLTVKPSEGTLKSANPKFFGFSGKNRGLYFVEICPAEVFLPFRLTPARIKALLKEGTLARGRADRALGVLAEKGPDDQLTAREKADRAWLGRLEASLATRKRLEQFLQRGWLSQEDFDRAATALEDLKPEDQLRDDEKAARARVEALAVSLSRRDRLERSLKEQRITRKHFDRALLAMQGPTAQQESDRKWLARLEAFLAGKDQETEEARQDEINSAECYFRLAVSAGKGAERVTRYAGRDGEPLILAARARPNLFKFFKLNNLIFAFVFSGIVLTFIQIARRNPNLFIRKIPGLEAIEEAIGRATEMGRSVYFVHGLEGMDRLSTIAAVNVLARVARRAAEYDIRIRVMNNRPIVTAVSQEVVQQAYTEAGRPDAYNADDVSFVASDQFSYVAAVSGMMVRERPAAIFYLGYFYAESLLLAETGASTGAIQVAGTDAYTQLPFFVTTCDYTLIGEELYAASAYLSREARMLGSLRGQDVGKAFLMVALVVGTAALTAGGALGANLNWIRNLLGAF